MTPASETTLLCARLMAKEFPLIGKLVARIDAAEQTLRTIERNDGSWYQVKSGQFWVHGKGAVVAAEYFFNKNLETTQKAA